MSSTENTLTASTVTNIVMKTKKKEKFLIIDEDDNVEYIVTKKTRAEHNIKYVMKRSKSDIWCESAKGKKIFTLIDDDSEITIQSHDDESLYSTNYGHIMALRLLLNLMNDNCTYPDKSRIFNK